MDSGRRAPDFPSRVVDQVVGAFMSALLVGFLSWIGGILDMKNDVKNQGIAVGKLETNYAVIQKDVSDIKMNGFKADADLDKRVTVMEHQHEEILRHESTHEGMEHVRRK
jgi:hypothetical protein